MKINFYKGHKTKNDQLNAYYVHPTIKWQPYMEHGFELVLWLWKWFVSIRVTLDPEPINKTPMTAILRTFEFALEEMDVARAHYEITNFEKVAEDDTTLTIRITLARPGIFIGKAGRNIDKFIKYMSRRLEKKVIIKIEDTKIWNP